MNGRTNSSGTTISDLEIPLDPCTNLVAIVGNGQLSLTWTDPKDKYATPEGEAMEDTDQLVSEWDHTVLVRKTGSQPAGPNDGTVVVSSSVRNQYQSTPYVDTGLTNGIMYYYGVFAYNEDGVVSPGTFTSAQPQAGTLLANLAEGTLIKILENGSLVEFYLAKHNYEPDLNGAGRELMVRKDSYDSGPYDSYDPGSPPYHNAYSGCDMDNMFNTTYKNLFSEKVQALISTTVFHYVAGGPKMNSFSSSTLRRSIFALSAIELSGTTWNTDYDEGDPLPIRNSLAGTWSRSPYTKDSAGEVIYVNYPGAMSSRGPYENGGRRPCFTLPADTFIDNDLALVES